MSDLSQLIYLCPTGLLQKLRHIRILGEIDFHGLLAAVIEHHSSKGSKILLHRSYILGETKK